MLLGRVHCVGGACLLCCQGVCVGIIRGVGRQAFGTVVMVVSYFVFAWSLGIPLMFATPLGLFGLWWGFVLGAGVQDVSFGAFIARLSWQREAAKVQSCPTILVAHSTRIAM